MKRITAWHSLIYLFLVCLVTIACTQLGVTPIKRAPTNVVESLYVASATGLGLTITFNQLRVDRLITSNQHAEMIQQLQIAHDTIESALKAAALGDISQAQTGLDKADIILHAAAVLLAELQAKKASEHATLIFLSEPPRRVSA